MHRGATAVPMCVLLCVAVACTIDAQYALCGLVCPSTLAGANVLLQLEEAEKMTYNLLDQRSESRSKKDGRWWSTSYTNKTKLLQTGHAHLGPCVLYLAAPAAPELPNFKHPPPTPAEVTPPSKTTFAALFYLDCSASSDLKLHVVMCGSSLQLTY